MVEKDFMENAFPLFSYHLGVSGCQSFFAYIKRNKTFYQRIFEYDEGTFLTKCLVNAYNKAIDLVEFYSIPARKNENKVNPMIYRLYSSYGIASVVVYWIKNGMKDDVEDIAKDLYLMMEKPLSYVRDHCL